ncbi:MAG: hypothetical protein ACLQVD_10505 [Capsulimonadaceae bacterium]
MRKDLKKVRWSRLSVGSGTADDVPHWLRAVESADIAVWERALAGLAEGLCHRGQVTDATAAAIPYLVELAAMPKMAARAHVLNLIGSIVRSALAQAHIDPPANKVPGPEAAVTGDEAAQARLELTTLTEHTPESEDDDDLRVRVDRSDDNSVDISPGAPSPQLGEWGRQTVLAVVQHAGLLNDLLRDGDTAIRLYAPWVLAPLTGRAAEGMAAVDVGAVRYRLSTSLQVSYTHEPVDVVRAGFIFAMGELIDGGAANVEALRSFASRPASSQEGVRTRQANSPVETLAAALVLATHDPEPPAAVLAILTEAAADIDAAAARFRSPDPGPSRRKDAGEAGDGSLPFPWFSHLESALQDALVKLEPVAGKAIMPALLSMFEQDTQNGKVPLRLLEFLFPNRAIPEAVAFTALSRYQQQALRAIYEHDGFWVKNVESGTTTHATGHARYFLLGMPTNRVALRDFIGSSASGDSPASTK